jgi:FKBP-type peptidyl-prolyl cis-trans isomerase 2
MRHAIPYLMIFVAALVLGCIAAKELTVSNGDSISVEYNLTIDNGTLIDSTVNRTPYTFVVGSSNTIKGFSYGVIGMKLNETKTIIIPPEDAYGKYNSALVITIPSNDSTLKVGDKITSVRTGLKGIVTFVNSTHVTGDFNVPLAGKTLTFVVKVINITKTKDYFNP